MAITLVLTLAAEKDVFNLQIFGDSLLVIKWMNKESEVRNFMLHPLVEEISGIVLSFDFHHLFSTYTGKGTKQLMFCQRMGCGWIVEHG
jgi:hypothetical protein